MRKIKTAFLLLGFLASLSVTAQNSKPFTICLEAGNNFLSNEISRMDFIRESASDYDYYGGYASTASGTFASAYAGVKLEKEILKNRLTVSTGLRYSKISSILGDTKPSGNDYLYLLYSTKGTETEFLKANGIAQYSYFAGIPVEIKYYPTSFHFVRSFLKLGGILNCRTGTQTDVIFTDPSMEIYEDLMAEKIKQPHNFNAFAYAGFGIRIGKEDRPSLSVEAQCPVVSLTPDAFTFIKPDAGIGMQISLYIPLTLKSK